MMRSVLRSLHPVYRANDFLDSDGISKERLRIRVRIRIHSESILVDFSGSSPQCAGNINAVSSIAISAVYYVFRCLVKEEVPATSGLLRPISVINPEGTMVNAQPPAAVAGGNVETSQRMVDTLLRAKALAAPDKFRPPASTMNNFTFWRIDPRNRQPYTYYETIAGGCGASRECDGVSASHSHMTNSWNTPTEVFEESYPVRVRRYAIRRNSGGEGAHRGGEGVIREIEFLTQVVAGLLTDRRTTAPYGLRGGRGE
jgi:N-methylhydantoinase B